MQTDTGSAAATPGASWVDPSTRTRETASFFGPSEDQVFGCLYEPAEPTGLGVVICCPLQAEMLRNYRREVLLARALAARGVAVQRFHYRGSGHSDGDTEAMTFDTMVADALLAREQLTRRTGVASIATVGARLGGLVAATAAAMTEAPLVLWEPVVDPARYIDEILRFRLVREIQGDDAVTSDALLEEMRSSGAVDVLGHTLERALYDSVQGRSLRTAVGDGIPAVLLVQMAPARSLRREYAALATAWEQRGIRVVTETVVDREAWWLSGDLWPVHETHAPTRQLVETTTSWISALAPVAEAAS